MIEASAGGPTRMKEQLSWVTVKMWKTVEKHYRVFIVVSEGGRLDFIAEFNPKCLAKKKVPVIDATYESSRRDQQKGCELMFEMSI